MTDLISRAAAIEYLMTNMGWRDEDGYEVDDADEKREIITDLVNGIPAVAAIPMEWLNNVMLNCDDEDSKAAWRVLHKWNNDHFADIGKMEAVCRSD